jgi:hypothetical protein
LLLKQGEAPGDTDYVGAGRRLGRVAAWSTVSVLAVQLLGAAPAWAHGPAYNAAAELKSRHVVVDPRMQSAVSVARASALEAAIGTRPVFVAVLPVGSGQFELAEIESILLEPGVYMLLKDGRVEVNVLGEQGVTARQASDAALAAMAAHPSDPGAALTDAVDREVAALTQYGVPKDASQVASNEGTGGSPPALWILLGVGALLIVGGAGVAVVRLRRAPDAAGSGAV